MFYKAIGYVIWKVTVGYLGLRFPRYRQAAVAAVLTGVAIAGYLATRSEETE